MRKILEKHFISIPEVKQILENLAQHIGDENLDTFQEATLDYARKFTKIEPEKVPAIKKLLMEDYKIPEKYAIMLINIFPATVEEVRTIFEKDTRLSKMTAQDITEMLRKMHELAE